MHSGTADGTQVPLLVPRYRCGYPGTAAGTQVPLLVHSDTTAGTVYPGTSPRAGYIIQSKSQWNDLEQFQMPVKLPANPGKLLHGHAEIILAM